MSRFVASLWALWFALVTVGPGGFGACPEHGVGHSGGHGGSSAVAAPLVSSHAPDDHAAMDHAAMGHGAMSHGATSHGAMSHGAAPAAERSSTPDQHHASCTCLGTCCMMAPSLLPAAPAEILARVVTRAATPTPAYRTVLAARRVFSQPYAIGPPAAPVI